MSWHTSPFTMPLVLSTAFSAVLVAYAWRRRDTVPAARAFAVQMAGLAEWTLCYSVELSAATLETKKLFACLRYPGISCAVLGFLAVAVHFVGRGAWLTRRRVVAASVLPALTVMLALTNERHHLMWRTLLPDPHGPALVSEHGPWFWLHLAFCYACLLGASVLIVDHGLRATRQHRRQSLVMLASVCIPWVVSAVHLSGVFGWVIDPTPFGIIACSVGFLWAVFRFRLLDILPVARATVVENMADGMMVVDQAERVLDLNAEARRMMGDGARRALGRPVSEVLAAFPAFLAKAHELTDGSSEVTVGAGADVRHYDLRVSPLRDENGDVAGRVLVWHDVTALKETERELVAGQTRLEQLARRQTIVYEALRLVGGQLDVGNVRRVAIQSIARLTGWPDVVLVVAGRGGLEVGEARRQFGGAMHVPERGVVARAFSTGRTQHVRDVAGDPDYVQDAAAIRSELAVPLRRGGRILGVLDVQSDRLDAFDADDVLLAESLADAVALALENAQLYERSVDDHGRLGALIEASRDGLLFVDHGGLVRVLNETAVRLLRLLAGPEAWIERPATELLATVRGWAPELDAALRAALREGAAAPEGEHEVGARLLKWSVVPVRADDAALGHLVVLRDVTEERMVERLRDDLTHTMVHDLRNPLTAVSGALELLEASARDARQQEVVALARASSDRMYALVNGILEVSRLESGRVPLECCRLELSDLVAEVLRLQQPLVPAARLTLEADVPEGLPAAWADPALVARVLQNLVGNAVKFTPAGRVRIAAALHDGTGMLRVDVADDGPGICETLRPRLFQKFATGRDRNRGSGLGLAFCRLAVEAHGGRIWALPGAERGTTFSFTLPVARA